MCFAIFIYTVNLKNSFCNIYTNCSNFHLEFPIFCLRFIPISRRLVYASLSVSWLYPLRYLSFMSQFFKLFEHISCQIILEIMTKIFNCLLISNKLRYSPIKPDKNIICIIYLSINIGNSYIRE